MAKASDFDSEDFRSTRNGVATILMSKQKEIPMNLQSQAIIIYHSRWVIAEYPMDILDYYWNWVYRVKNIKLNKPRFGSHISVIRGIEEFDRTSELYCKYHNQTIVFIYSCELQTNGDYWWIPVESKSLETLRQELGLKKHPEFGFHLTIGREK